MPDDLMPDTRPQIEPDCFSSRDLPADGNFAPLMDEIAEQWRGKVEFARWTIVSDEYPNPPYPNALYFEGWSTAPERHDPPGVAAPFNFPLVAQEPSA